MGGLSVLHWLILLVVVGACLAIPVAIVILLLMLVGKRPSGPNLVPCPDCGRQVSRLAAACPHCGRPLKA